jgi:small GTP-binding protein
MDFEKIYNLARKAQKIATDCGQESLSSEIQNEVVDFLNNSWLKVPFLGEFSVGKSSILNRLLDEKILPLDIKPTTSVLTEIKYGEKKGFFLESQENKKQKLTEDEFQEIAAGEQTPPPFSKLSLTLPHPILSQNLILIDTPGVHSMNNQHQEITYGLLPKVDAAFVVMDANQGDVPRTVMSFLRDHVLAQSMEKLIFVVNRIDDIPQNNRQEHVEQFKKTLKDLLPHENSNPIVVPSIATPGEDIPESLGIEKIKEEILNNILPSKKSILNRGATKNLSIISAKLIKNIEAQKKAINSTVNDMDKEIEQLKEARKKLNLEMQKLKDKVFFQIKKIQNRSGSRIDSMLSKVSNRAEKEIHESRSVDDDRFQLSLQQKIQGWMAKEFENTIAKEIDPDIKSLTEEVQVSVKSIQSNIPELSLEPISLPGGVFLDLLVEVGLLTIFNLVLPGEWVVALFARFLGSAAKIEKLTEPIKNYLKIFVGGVFGNIGIQKIVTEVRKAIFSSKTELVLELNGQLMGVANGLTEAIETNFKELIENKENALREARKKLHLDFEAKKEESKNLQDKVDSIKEIVEEINRM